MGNDPGIGLSLWQWRTLRCATFQVEQKSPNPPEKGTLDTTLEVELQTEREALDRKEKEVLLFLIYNI
uniref:Uncharacterized protein n=1 Tax=Anguilla anguilla TaxID=7936 RepID=A0A0E9XLQ6_ANGAN